MALLTRSFLTTLRSSVCYAPNSDYLLISSLDSVHRLHDCRDLRGRPQDVPPQPQVVRSYVGHVNSKFSVFSAICNVGSDALVLSGSENNQVSAFGTLLCRFFTSAPLPQMCVWDLQSSALVGSATGHTGAVLAVAANPDPLVRQFASAGADCSVRLWNVLENAEQNERDQ